MRASRARSTASDRDARSGWRARARPPPARRGTAGCAPRRRAARRRSSGRCGGRRCARARGTAGRCSETPASISRAMCGCVSRARIVPSRLKRSSPPRPTSAAFSSLTAAWPSKRPSLRAASHTLPMPPCADWRHERVGADRDAGQRRRRRGWIGGAESRKPSAVSRRCSSSSASTSAAESGSSFAQRRQAGLALARAAAPAPGRGGGWRDASGRCPWCPCSRSPIRKIGNGRRNTTSHRRGRSRRTWCR